MPTIKEIILAGEVRKGDLALVKNGERGALNGGIRYAQANGLRNLDPGLPKHAVEQAAAYTHAACVWSDEAVLEQFYPHARSRNWYSVTQGSQQVLFRRPVMAWNDPAIGVDVATQAMEDVLKRTPYGWGDLVAYWFRFGGCKLVPDAFGWKRHFADVFRSKRYETCAAEYVRWCQGARIRIDQQPESFYPARLAIDRKYFRTVGIWSAGTFYRTH